MEARAIPTCCAALWAVWVPIPLRAALPSNPNPSRRKRGPYWPHTRGAGCCNPASQCTPELPCSGQQATCA